MEHSTSRLAFALKLAALLIVTAMVFAPATDHQFVDWDDQAQIYFNPDFNPVTWQHLTWNITHTRLTVWMPLTYFVWGGIASIAHQSPDKQGIALDPMMFHGACILFHLIAVWLAFLVLRRLIGRDTPAVFGTALFALHPLQAEPVAWASGMYTVLSGAFCLATTYAYLRSVDSTKAPQRWIWLAAATLLFVGALLTKPSAIVLPLIVLAIQLFFPSPGTPGEGRGEGRTAQLKGAHLADERRGPHPNPLPAYRARGPFFGILLLWLPLAVADFWIAKSFHLATNVPSLPIGQRLLIAGDAIGFYLGKLLLPIHLVPDYGRWPAKVLAMPATRWIAVIAIALIIVAASIVRRAPRVTLAIVVFLLGIAPFLGLVRFDFQFYSTVADRYAYLALLGPAFLLSAILSKYPSKLVYTLAFACLFACAIQTVLQVLRWHDTQTLFSYTASIRPDSFISHRILAAQELSSDPASAEKHFQQALAIRPDDPTTHYNYAILLERRRDLPAAITQLRATVALNPLHAKALDDLGVAMMQQRKFDDARIYFDQSIQAAEFTHDAFAQPHLHLAMLLTNSGDDYGAIDELHKALAINPNLAGAQHRLDLLEHHRSSQ